MGYCSMSIAENEVKVPSSKPTCNSIGLQQTSQSSTYTLLMDGSKSIEISSQQ